MMLVRCQILKKKLPSRRASLLLFPVSQAHRKLGKKRKKEKKKFKEFENGFWNNRSSIISLIGWCLVAWKHLHNLLRTKLWGSFSEGLVNNVYLVLWEYTIFLLWKKKNTWNQGTKYNWFDEFFLHASQMTVEFVKTTTSVHSRAN